MKTIITNETPIALLTVGQLLNVIRSSDNKQNSPKETIPEIFGTELICRLTGYSLSTIYAKTSRKEIPHFRRDGRLFFRRNEIEEWLTSNPVTTIEGHSRKMDEALTKRSRRAV